MPAIHVQLCSAPLGLVMPKQRMQCVKAQFCWTHVQLAFAC